MLVSGGGALPTEAKYSPIDSALPKYATRPIESTMQLSKPAKTEAGGWWIVHAIVMARAWAIFLRKLMIMTAEAESTPLVGSSRNSTDGRFASATAIESRRLLPPERPLMNSLPAFTSCWSSRPTLFIRSWTAASRAAASSCGWYSRTACSRWSRTVSDAQRVSNCSTDAAVSLYFKRVNGAPWTRMCPCGTPPFLLSVSMLSSVVLPAPDGPRMANTLPGFTLPDMSCRRSLSRVEPLSLSSEPAALPSALTFTV
jgi:hypothetical protein